MNTVAFYRTCVLGSLAFAVLGGAVDFIPGMVPEEVLPEEDPDGGVGYLLFAAIAGLGVGVASLVATVGLALFSPWSRPLALACTAASLVLYPMLPAMMQSGWASLFFYLSALAWGAALAMAYFSPLSSRFSRAPA